jgi:hypothetical protein
MAEYDNTNRGSIWPNKKKEKDTQPDFTGSQNVCCPKCGERTDFWFDAWKRKADANPAGPSLSFKVKPKDGQAPPVRTQSGNEETQTGAAPARSPVGRDMDDEIPFSAEFR